MVAILGKPTLGRPRGEQLKDEADSEEPDPPPHRHAFEEHLIRSPTLPDAHLKASIAQLWRSRGPNPWPNIEMHLQPDGAPPDDRGCWGVAIVTDSWCSLFV